MLDYNKLLIQFTELLNTFTVEDLQDWLEFNELRIANEALEEYISNKEYSLKDKTYKLQPMRFRITTK